MIDIDALTALARDAKVRAERATPGPWLEDECYIFSDTDGLVPADTPLFTVHYDNDRECSADESQRLTEIWREQHANADFVVAARTDVPALADAVLALVEMVRQLNSELAVLRNILSFGPTLPEHVSSRVYAVVMDAIRDSNAETLMNQAELVVTAIRHALIWEQGIEVRQL